MNNIANRAGLKALLTRLEGFVEAFQFLLSALAVVLVASHELVGASINNQIPWLNWSWLDAQVMVRTFTWLVFMGVFVVYGLFSGNLLRYARQHIPELLICITWLPFHDGSLHHLTSVLSLEMLTLIGSISHGLRVARWTIKRFSAHPMIVIGATALVLITSASAILTQVEPQTFPNLWEASWFCVVTIFTVGYGDITPHSLGGRLVATVLIIGGVGLAGVFIGIVSKMASRWLLSKDEADAGEMQAKVLAELEKNNKLLAELTEEQRTTNSLHRELLTELRKPNEKAD